jgi:hypothetical protein
VPIAGVVADANVLLSVVVGHAALRVFTKFETGVHGNEFNREEVEGGGSKLKRGRNDRLCPTRSMG